MKSDVQKVWNFEEFFFYLKIHLSYRREVVCLRTCDDFSLRFLSKPSEPTELLRWKPVTDKKFLTLCN